MNTSYFVDIKTLLLDLSVPIIDYLSKGISSNFYEQLTFLDYHPLFNATLEKDPTTLSNVSALIKITKQLLQLQSLVQEIDVTIEVILACDCSGYCSLVLPDKTGMAESFLPHIQNGTHRWNEDSFEICPKESIHKHQQIKHEIDTILTPGNQQIKEHLKKIITTIRDHRLIPEIILPPEQSLFIDDYKEILMNLLEGSITLQQAEQSLYLWKDALPESLLGTALLTLKYDYIHNMITKN